MGNPRTRTSSCLLPNGLPGRANPNHPHSSASPSAASAAPKQDGDDEHHQSLRLDHDPDDQAKRGHHATCPCCSAQPPNLSLGNGLDRLHSVSSSSSSSSSVSESASPSAWPPSPTGHSSHPPARRLYSQTQQAHQVQQAHQARLNVQQARQQAEQARHHANQARHHAHQAHVQHQQHHPQQPATSSLTISLRAAAQAAQAASAFAASITPTSPSFPHRSPSVRSTRTTRSTSITSVTPPSPMFHMSPPSVPPTPSLSTSTSPTPSSLASSLASSGGARSVRGGGLGLVRMQSFRVSGDTTDSDNDTSSDDQRQQTAVTAAATRRPSGSRSIGSRRTSTASISTLASSLSVTSLSVSNSASMSSTEDDQSNSDSESSDSELEYLRSRGLAPPARRSLTTTSVASLAIAARFISSSPTPALSRTSSAFPTSPSSSSSSSSGSDSEPVTSPAPRGFPVQLAIRQSSLSAAAVAAAVHQQSVGSTAAGNLAMSPRAARLTQPYQSNLTRAPSQSSPSSSLSAPRRATPSAAPPAPLDTLALSLGMTSADLRAHLTARFVDLHGPLAPGASSVADTDLIAMFRRLMLLDEPVTAASAAAVATSGVSATSVTDGPQPGSRRGSMAGASDTGDHVLVSVARGGERRGSRHALVVAGQVVADHGFGSAAARAL